jgi:hypothetical protein
MNALRSTTSGSRFVVCARTAGRRSPPVLPWRAASAAPTWALVSAVLLRPLPIEGADRLFQVDEPPPPNVVEFWVPRFNCAVLESIRDSGTFEAIAASGVLGGPMSVIGRESCLSAARSTLLRTIFSRRSASTRLVAARFARPALEAARLDLARSLRDE